MLQTTSGLQTICKPKIPYLGPIDGGLEDGSRITINGRPLEDKDRFAVNLLCGKGENSNIALHINPRFDGWDKVVFNTRESGDWQSEDKVRPTPFERGKSFVLVIKVTSDCYQIKVDKKDVHTYKHRLPLKDVCAVQISGDVFIERIDIKGKGGCSGGNPGSASSGGFGLPLPGGNPMQGGWHGGNPGQSASSGGGGWAIPGGNPPMGGWPDGGQSASSGGFGLPLPGGNPPTGGWPDGGGPCPGGPGGLYPQFPEWGNPAPTMPSMAGMPVINPPVPFTTGVKGMLLNKTVKIGGKVKRGAQRFHINFSDGHGNKAQRNIAFHFNPRIKDDAVVRNTKVGGCWGKEERECFFSPFKEGEKFDISICCKDKKFEVYVNKKPLCDYNYRCNINEVENLEIEGDVELYVISFD
ncbi:galectin-4-like isoform 2-T2 [Pholidichthys leucotaenia]